MTKLDLALIVAWQQGDTAARNTVWTQLWSVVEQAARKHCSRFSHDPVTAADRALTAIDEAYLEIDRQVQSQQHPWADTDDFVAWVTARVIFRCHDQRRDTWRENRRRAEMNRPDSDSESDQLERKVAAHAPSAEDDMLAGERDRAALRGVIRATAAWREICRTRATLVAVVDEIRNYLRRQFVAAVPPGTTAAASLEDLAEQVEGARMDMSQRELYGYVMSQLQISRNQLDQRMKRLRRLIREHRLPTDGWAWADVPVGASERLLP